MRTLNVLLVASEPGGATEQRADAGRATETTEWFLHDERHYASVADDGQVREGGGRRESLRSLSMRSIA